MAVSARATDKLDAICIGATPECLFAAASLAAAGKHVRVLDLRAAGKVDVEAGPCLVDVEAAGWLNLVSHGLRYGAAAPLIAVAQDRSLVLWPEADATIAGLSSLSERDAAAYPGFVTGMMRLAAAGGTTSGVLSSLFGLGLVRDPMMASALHGRSTSLSRFLEEAFESPLLRGALAQLALEGTAVSPTVPGSARLLARQSLMSLIGLPVGKRQVAGGTAALGAALNSALKSLGSLEVLPDVRVRQLIVEREAVQGVVLADGSVLRAPQVILGRLGDAALELLHPLPFDVPQAMRPAPCGQDPLHGRHAARDPRRRRGPGYLGCKPSSQPVARAAGALARRVFSAAADAGFLHVSSRDADGRRRGAHDVACGSRCPSCSPRKR
jgi:phytoene dehydrogenase-like protein